MSEHRRRWNSTLPGPEHPMKRTQMPPRTTRIRPVSRANAARLFRRNFGSKARVIFVKMHACQVCGMLATESRPNINAHVVHTRGAGGDYLCICCLCAVCDHEQESYGAFWIIAGLDPVLLADALELEWQEQAV